MLPVRRLRGEWWELNELETMLIGAEGGGTIRLGDPVRVMVEKVDAPRGRVDLAPIELSTTAGRLSRETGTRERRRGLRQVLYQPHPVRPSRPGRAW